MRLLVAQEVGRVEGDLLHVSGPCRQTIVRVRLPRGKYLDASSCGYSDSDAAYPGRRHCLARRPYDVAYHPSMICFASSLS